MRSACARVTPLAASSVIICFCDFPAAVAVFTYSTTWLSDMDCAHIPVEINKENTNSDKIFLIIKKCCL